MMTALTDKYFSEHGKATQVEGDQKTPRKEIWRKESGEQVSGTAGGRWRHQHKMELV